MALAVNSRHVDWQSSSENSKYKKRNKVIKETTKLLDQGIIDIEDFLKLMASDENRKYDQI